MPSCLHCPQLIENKCASYEDASRLLGRPLPPPPLGGCIIPIINDYVAGISAGMSVLDIGCGTYPAIRDHCQLVGASYNGIEVERQYFGRPVIATRLENLADLSYPDDAFDLVLGNQTMEHWAEHGCSVQWGLYQCFRVCKSDGRVQMNVPVHFHGTRDFMLGRIDKIIGLFLQFSTTVSLETWGSPSFPIKQFVPYPCYPALRSKAPFVLDIRAVKNRALPKVDKPRFMPTGRLAELLNYPLSYNVYRCLRKLLTR